MHSFVIGGSEFLWLIFGPLYRLICMECSHQVFRLHYPLMKLIDYLHWEASCKLGKRPQRLYCTIPFSLWLLIYRENGLGLLTIHSKSHGLFIMMVISSTRKIREMMHPAGQWEVKVTKSRFSEISFFRIISFVRIWNNMKTKTVFIVTVYDTW
jgi:hypothetical protein